MSGITIRCSMVSVVALRGEGADARVLLLRRAGEYLHAAWSYVAGHVDAGETGWQAARRELLEETGLVPQQWFATSFCEQFYAPADDCIETVPAFVAMLAPDPVVRINPEHSDFRWLALADAREMLPFGSQRDLFDYVQREFLDRAPCEWLRMTTP